MTGHQASNPLWVNVFVIPVSSSFLTGYLKILHYQTSPFSSLSFYFSHREKRRTTISFFLNPILLIGPYFTLTGLLHHVLLHTSIKNWCFIYFLFFCKNVLLQTPSLAKRFPFISCPRTKRWLSIPPTLLYDCQAKFVHFLIADVAKSFLPPEHFCWSLRLPSMVRGLDLGNLARVSSSDTARMCSRSVYKKSLPFCQVCSLLEVKIAVHFVMWCFLCTSMPTILSLYICAVCDLLIHSRLIGN